MTQNLSVYWHRLTQRTTDDQRAEAPVLDLAGCFGTPPITAVRPEVARLADAAPARVPSR